MRLVSHPIGFFRDLQSLAMPTPGKPDPHENLTDILELVAVAEGLKPAHLQGQGHHDEGRLGVLETICQSHGLRTLRTRPLIPFLHRPRRYDAKIVAFEDDDNVRRQKEGPDVLWVYASSEVEPRLPDLVMGRSGVADVLGYPDCCETHASEEKVVVAEVRPGHHRHVSTRYSRRDRRSLEA